MTQEILIQLENVIHFKRLSHKFNERHFEVAFAAVEVEFQEKARSFWKRIFAPVEMEKKQRVIIQGYVKEGVAWYHAQDMERASVDEEIYLNQIFKALDTGALSLSKMCLRIQLLINNIQSARDRERLAAYT
ncbi:MAG: hypothetical protein ACPGJS_19235 [Flammeovirgaceae bacterium]